MADKLLRNRYRIIRRLASGAFGGIFLAEDTERLCIIRQTPLHSSNIDIVIKFLEREVNILARLNESDWVPKLYAHFREEENFYVVQEYIEGETLDQKVLKEGLLDETKVAQILRSILIALEDIHSHSILHRDIKPSNIILRRHSKEPVIIDFGAATCIDNLDDFIVGSLGYMSPEQAEGKPTNSSDLYSLGMTAVFLLTGRNPNQIERDMETGEFHWHQYASYISPEFKAVIDKAIALKLKERYSNAKEMLVELVDFTHITADSKFQFTPPVFFENRTRISPVFFEKRIFSLLIFAALVIYFITQLPLSVIMSLLVIMPLSLITYLVLKITNINIPSINSCTYSKKGKYVIAFACGCAFLGSLTGYTSISIIGALIGGLYGLVFNEASNSDSTDNFFNRVIFPKNLFRRGDHMIALASGGAFLGGIIAQLPGSIIGALAGAIFSLFTMDKII